MKKNPLTIRQEQRKKYIEKEQRKAHNKMLEIKIMIIKIQID